MNNKLNLFVVLAILILPILLYTVLKSPENAGHTSLAASGKPKMIKFSSPLCMECQELEKSLMVVEPKYKDKVDFVKFNVNSSSDLTQTEIKKYGVKVVPTSVFIDKKGKVYKQVEGTMSVKELETILDKLING